jgi:hypothetical protein
MKWKIRFSNTNDFAPTELLKNEEILLSARMSLMVPHLMQILCSNCENIDDM